MKLRGTSFVWSVRSPRTPLTPPNFNLNYSVFHFVPYFKFRSFQFQLKGRLAQGSASGRRAAPPPMQGAGSDAESSDAGARPLFRLQKAAPRRCAWKHPLVRPIASDSGVFYDPSIPPQLLGEASGKHASPYARLCLGMPRRMPWHAKAYAYAWAQGICLGIPRHMPRHTKAYA